MKSPIVEFRKLIWRIESAPFRRAAAIAAAVFVELPVWALYWLICTPAMIAFLIIGNTVMAAWETVTLTVNSVRAEPAEWRERRRVFLLLWRSSRSQWEASRPKVRINNPRG